MAPTTLRVMLVDDHAFVRAAIRQALTAPDIEVVAEAASAEVALDVATSVRPDVVLLDLDLPGMNGIALLRELAPRLPGTRFVMLSATVDPDEVLDSLRLGAVGYLTKDLDGPALLRSVRGAAQGDLAMPRRLAARAIRDLVDAARHGGGRSGTGFGSLSPRETETLRLLAQGLTDREIAETLTISTRTVETHVSNILRKLEARNRAEAARRWFGDR
ncbi:MAG TPA: response regulator transcription factor [Candidatus Limnocylindrales bacterium]|nr:response regulator transcription factor [Candidatus Limnocylindrales bacterium]